MQRRAICAHVTMAMHGACPPLVLGAAMRRAYKGGGATGDRAVCGAGRSMKTGVTNKKAEKAVGVARGVNDIGATCAERTSTSRYWPGVNCDNR